MTSTSKKRKKLLKAIERDFKAYIFKRDEKIRPGLCRFDWCNNPKQCWFHFIRQSRSLKTKFDERNVIYSCLKCNVKMESGEGWAWAWFFKTFGLEQAQEIERASHGAANWGIYELEEMALEWSRKRFESLTGKEGVY